MFRDLIDAIPDALLVVDEHGDVVQANAQADRLFGHAPKGLIGRSIDALLPSESPGHTGAHRTRDMAQSHARLTGAGGQVLAGSRADGSTFPVEIALRPFDDPQGLRYLLTLRDISESQRARQALVRARYDAAVARFGQIALETAEESNILGNIPLLLADTLGVEIVALGFVADDRASIVIQRSVGLETAPHLVDALLDLRTPSLAQHLADGVAWVVDDIAALPAPPHADDDTTPLRGSAALVPLLDRNRAMGLVLAVSREGRHFDHDALHLLQSVANMASAVVQRRRSEDQLAHAQRLDAVGQLTGGIAHDFNNLLTVLSGSLQLLDDEVRDQPSASDLIASALRSIGRGAELTGKLLAFARRQQLAPEVVDVPALLHDLQRMLQRTLGDSIRLHLRCPPTLPAAYIDPVQLDAALVNLALNARDAMPRGGEIGIDASERIIGAQDETADLAAGHYLLVTVFDTGHGMAPETLARALEPFFTTKQAGRGSGLGLSMVYGFVKQSGGHMEIRSALGYGARVNLYLPVSAQGAARPADVSSTTARAATNAHETVLVVEDDSAVRNVTVAFLQRAGYAVLTAGSGAQALEQLDAHPQIALLFTDVHLGDSITGRDVARYARRRDPQLPILLTTGFEDDAVLRDARDDAFDLLRKPYRREQLASAVRRLLDARTAGTR